MSTRHAGAWKRRIDKKYLGPVTKTIRTKYIHGEKEHQIQPGKRDKSTKPGSQVKKNRCRGKNRSDLWRTVNSSSEGNTGEVYFESTDVDEDEKDGGKNDARSGLDFSRKHMYSGEERVSDSEEG